MSEKESYLFVVAHPDDEILGAGATISNLAKNGHAVYICVLSCECNTRSDALLPAMFKTHKDLGVKDTSVFNFGCLRFKDEDHHTMVKAVEKSIRHYQPDVVVTHHPADLNNDHYIASIVCQEAVRLPQRQLGYSHKIRHFAFMEVPSETEFGLNPAWGKFTPTCYHEVDADDIRKKIDCLYGYDNVIRDNPHPRSIESLTALATIRGTESGYHFAEAFQTVFRLGV